MDTQASPPVTPIAVFRAGRHQAVDGRDLPFSADAIAQMAANYDPARDPAPLVVGHPKLDAPAYGWVKRLEARDGVLYAEPDQVEPQFAELVRAGRLKKVSATIYLPGSPGNPKPGEYYLRNVGFLGAAAPAVKGLPVASFAEGDGAVAFAAFPASTETIMPDPTAPDAPEPPNVPNAEALARQQQDLAAREKALAEREAKARRDDAAAFAEGLVQDGRLLPRQKAPVVELLLTLGAAPLSFAEGDGPDGGKGEKPAQDILRGLLGEMPQQVSYDEKSADTGLPGAAAFAAPQGVLVDTARLEIHAKAKAWQTDHPGTDFLTAVRAVGG